MKSREKMEDPKKVTNQSARIILSESDCSNNNQIFIDQAQTKNWPTSGPKQVGT